MLAVQIGSYHYFIKSGFSISIGLLTLYFSGEFIFIAKYVIDGYVIITSISYSSNILCLNTSICSIPKNPHLNPDPRAALASYYSVTELSVKHNFFNAFSRSS